MSPKITISVPDALYEKIQKWKDSFNFSKVFQNAISNEIAKKERFQDKLKEDETIEEVLENGNFETPEGQYATGKEVGFVYAKTAPYPEIKNYEQYVEGWEKRDPDVSERFSYSLDFLSLMDKLGLIGDPVEVKDEKKYMCEASIPLTWSFELGFMNGIIEFIKGECSSVQIRKLVIKRDKEMALAKDKDEKIKIFLSYRHKIMHAWKEGENL